MVMIYTPLQFGIRLGRRIKTLLVWIGKTAAVVAGLSLLISVTAGYYLSAPGYVGPVTDHFDGERFHHPWSADTSSRGIGDMLRWRFNRKVGPWRDWVESPPGPPPPRHVPRGNMRITFVNHATVLVQMDETNILADPIWSDRASPFSWIGPRRVRAAGIRFEDLPRIHAVVLSHNHYDHTDLHTLQRLRDTHDPVFYCHLGNKALLEKAGIRKIKEMDWWQSSPASALVSVHSVPAQHFSSRGFFDRNKTLWGGYVLSGPAGNLYFAGDTALGPHFEDIRKRFAPLRLSLLPIGAFRPQWFMKAAHLSPAEAVQAHVKLQSGTSMAIHFGTFHLGDDGETEPIEKLDQARQAAGIADSRFWILQPGEGRDAPPVTN